MADKLPSTVATPSAEGYGGQESYGGQGGARQNFSELQGLCAWDAYRADDVVEPITR